MNVKSFKIYFKLFVDMPVITIKFKYIYVHLPTQTPMHIYIITVLSAAIMMTLKEKTDLLNRRLITELFSSPAASVAIAKTVAVVSSNSA